MAEIANSSFIEGYCNVYNSTFTFYLNFTNISENYTQIDVTTDSNGYWRYALTNGQQVTYMNSAFSRHSQAESDKLVSVRFNKNFVSNIIGWHNTFGNAIINSYACRNLERVDGFVCNNAYQYGLYYTFYNCNKLEYIYDSNVTSKSNNFALFYTFYMCKNLRRIEGIERWSFDNLISINCAMYGCYSLESDISMPLDLSSWNTSSLTEIIFMFGSVQSDDNSWYSEKGWRIFSKLRDVSLFDIPNGCTITNNFMRFYGGQDNFTINNIGIVSGTITFEKADLNLQSAINILSALTDLQGGSATITFSASTLALVQASINNGDADTISAVTNAIDNGWTITGLNVIDGYAYDNQGVYPANVTFKVNGSNTTVVVNSNNGYFIYAISNLNYMNDAFRNDESVESVRVYAPNAAIPMHYFSRRSKIKSVECTGVTATSISIAFGLSYAEYSNGDRQPLTSLKLPRITNSTMSTSGSCVVWCTNLIDVQCDFIENGFSCAQSPLSLQSAINILSALQDVTSYGGATLTFSSTTSALVQADTTAMNLVAQAQANGWTIAFN